MEKIRVAVVGPGNIGSDLMYKILRSRNLQMEMMAGIVSGQEDLIINVAYHLARLKKGSENETRNLNACSEPGKM